MANEKHNLKGFARLNKRLYNIKKNIESFSQDTTKALAEYGRDTARSYLISGIAISGSDFTQKDGFNLADCIQAEQVSKYTWQVVARANRAPEDAHNSQHWQLFFAEYGAGIWNHDYTGTVKALNRTYKGRERKYPWWLYKDNYGEWHKVWGSVPIRYMFQARQAMRQEMSGVLGKVKTNILRGPSVSGGEYGDE
jgi:hypothetical protein